MSAHLKDEDRAEFLSRVEARLKFRQQCGEKDVTWDECVAQELAEMEKEMNHAL